jgi:hypothetical protein
MIAVPDQVIIAIDPELTATDLSTAIADLTLQLSEIATVDEAVPDGNAALLMLKPGAARVEQILTKLPELQKVGISVDLNYLEPVQPNDAFRPVDDPHLTAEYPPNFTGPKDDSVLVIDSPPVGPGISYDADQNHLVDEDHGHGRFIETIIARAGVGVQLVGIAPPDPTPLGPGTRWSPMVFSDFDIITVLNSIEPPTVLNLSLGGVGCQIRDIQQPPGQDAIRWGIGERLALARVMNTMWNNSESLWFVAAAGNNGKDVLHFPAAWRHQTAMSEIAQEIGNTDTDIRDEILTMSDHLRKAMFAVGSVETEPDGELRDDEPSDFSNCGTWVNAAAYGRLQVGEYPSSAENGYTTSAQPGPATWSGTSFAAANFSAALAAGLVDPDPNNFDPAVFDPSTGARMMDPNTNEGLPCPESTTSTTIAG